MSPKLLEKTTFRQTSENSSTLAQFQFLSHLIIKSADVVHTKAQLFQNVRSRTIDLFVFMTLINYDDDQRIFKCNLQSSFFPHCLNIQGEFFLQHCRSHLSVIEMTIAYNLFVEISAQSITFFSISGFVYSENFAIFLSSCSLFLPLSLFLFLSTIFHLDCFHFLSIFFAMYGIA